LIDLFCTKVVDILKVYINARFLTQQITGVQQFAFEICRYLQHDDLQFVLLIPPGTAIPKALAHHSFLVVGSLSGYFWEQIELSIFLKRKGNPLLLNFCNTAPLIYQNQFVTIHDLAFMNHPEWFSASFSMTYKYLIPRITSRSKKVLTVSKTIQHQLVQYLNVESEILYNGLPFSLLGLANVKNPERKKMIVTVSSINPRKNLTALIEAFTLAELPNYELVIVGASNSVFRKLTFTPSSAVRFTGYVTNDKLIALYRQSELFVSLSKDEGFGIPVLEALHFGCKVLLSDIDVYKECFSEVAQFTCTNNVQQIANDIKVALNQQPLAVPVSLFEKYNYAASAKKLMQLLIETNKKQ